jgi:hypothetical protein
MEASICYSIEKIDQFQKCLFCEWLELASFDFPNPTGKRAILDTSLSFLLLYLIFSRPEKDNIN